MHDANLIGFKSLTISDLKYMHKWLNSDHVKEWYSKKSWTIKEIEEKHIPNILNEKPTQGYLILYDKTPIGYIQTYKIHDYPDYAHSVGIDENASGLDLFIGEKEYLHKGLGMYIISRFLKEVIFKSSDSESCIIGPASENTVAKRTYEKVGFKYVKTIKTNEDELENIMRLTKTEFMQNAIMFE